MFSVIIPVHNKLPHLDRSINSVLNQTYKEFELILIDDASSDGSEELIKEYQDPRIKCFRRDKPGPGGYAARNLGIKNSKYDWIAFLDADDKWEMDFLLHRFNTIKKYSNVDIISSKWVYSKDGMEKEPKKIKRFNQLYNIFTITDFFLNNPLMWTGVATIKKDILLKAGLFPEGRCERGGDMDTWMRCLYINEKSVFLNTQLAIYYRDTINQVTDNIKNPSTQLCSLSTIEEIRAKSRNKKLLKAIDVYCFNYVYGRAVREIKRNSKSRVCLKIIDSRYLRAKALLKYYMFRILYFLNVKK